VGFESRLTDSAPADLSLDEDRYQKDLGLCIDQAMLSASSDKADLRLPGKET
jgi:hypothetical protein